VNALSSFSPAKINLFLAITGRRADGYHNLLSVAAPLAWGDELSYEPGAEGAPFVLHCDTPGVPLGETNLIIRAAQSFATAASWRFGGVFHLTKRIPMGAGLGGGSSNAATALRLLNQAAGQRLSADKLHELAASLGSDCPLFLADAPVVMRGRGEQISLLDPSAAARLRGRRLILFKPGFGISTPWAYARMAEAAPAHYLPEPEAEERLARWISGKLAPEEGLLFNNMEPVAFSKYMALPTLLDRLARVHGLAPRMSGSGSACFSFLPEAKEAAPVLAEIGQAWGPGSVLCETRIA